MVTDSTMKDEIFYITYKLILIVIKLPFIKIFIEINYK